jgi:hypothetical protein
VVPVVASSVVSLIMVASVAASVLIASVLEINADVVASAFTLYIDIFDLVKYEGNMYCISLRAGC